MALKVMSEGSIRHYIGLSSDTKPGSTADGTTVYEVNTGLHWVYFDGVWYEDLTLIYALSQALNGGR